jgi:hypothetical protein
LSHQFFNIFSPLLSSVYFFNFNLENIKVHYFRSKSTQRLSSRTTNTYKKTMSSWLFQNSTDSH